MKDRTANVKESYVSNKKRQKVKIKKVLVSQPEPADLEKSPYGELAKNYNLDIDFNKFIKIEGVNSKEFRQNRLKKKKKTADRV